MRKPTFLELRGAASVLRHASIHVLLNPIEPAWGYPEIDKYGNAKSVDDALNILRTAERKIHGTTH